MKNYSKLATALMLIIGLALFAGCGADTGKAKGKTKTTTRKADGQLPPIGPRPDLSAQYQGDTGKFHELLSITQKGEYAGVGFEYLGGLQPHGSGDRYPDAVQWVTRFEFLKEDIGNYQGQNLMDLEKVEARSFNRPFGERSLVRFILENDAQNIRYIAVGRVYFRTDSGSLDGGEKLRGYDSNGKMFDILFQNKMGREMNFVFGDDGLFRTGGILLRNSTGEHMILYH